MPLLEHFSRSVSRCQLAVARAYQRLSDQLSATDAEEVAVKARYASVMERLQAYADRTGVRIPYQIRFHAWWRAPLGNGDGNDEAMLSQSLGTEMILWQTILCPCNHEHTTLTNVHAHV